MRRQRRLRRVAGETEDLHIAVRDADAEKHGIIRIVDESGDDYLYPQGYFRPIDFPQAIRKAVLAAA